MREVEERRAAGTPWVAPTRREYGECATYAWHYCERGRRCTAAVRDASAPRVRSGLAHAAGFAGLAVLFRPSFSTLYLWHLGFNGATGLFFFLLTGLAAPAALALSFYAAAALDRAPGKKGRAQAMLGFFAGLSGTIAWLAEVNSWLRFIGW